MSELDKILKAALEIKASDVHILIEMPPMVRQFGDIKRLPGFDPIDKETAFDMLVGILDVDQRTEFEVHKEVDFCHEIPQLSRFRTNIYLEERGVGGAFRIVPSQIMTAEKVCVDSFLPDPVL